VTAPAPLRTLGPPALQPAAASGAVRPVIEGLLREGRVLGASAAAVWLAVNDEVLVVSTRDAVRLPNGVSLPLPSAARPFDRLTAGDHAAVGNRLIVAPGLRVSVRRWWEPRPRLPRTAPEAVRDRMSELRSLVALLPDHGLGSALAAADPGGVGAAAAGLIGNGAGLTPDGDDLLAAALAAYRLVGEATGSPRTAEVVNAAAGDVAALAARRTTSLSASLLRHACAGNVADPVAGVLRAIAGGADLEPAVRDLLDVGHSSGASLAAGVLIGAAAACGEVLQ
jgi:hypothetical protein